MDFGIVRAAAHEVAKLVNLVKTGTNYYTTNSLAEVSKLTRVEPLTILSKDLLNLEYMPDVTNSMLNLFSAYYLQAINIMTKVKDVEVIRLLDRLNPDRDSTGFLLAEGMSNRNESSIGLLGMESYQYSLPMSSVPRLALEEDNKNPLNDVANLSVGKLLNVKIAFVPGQDPTPGHDDNHQKGSDRTVDLQVAVRLAVSVVPDNTIQHLLTFKSEDNSIIERYHAWRSGRIGFIKDLIFAQDLIDEWKRASINDNTDTIQEIIRRVNNSKKYGLLTKNPSLVSASNIFIISEQTARDVESKLGGKLSNKNIRTKAFDNTYAMVIAVVDREYERVTIYTRGTEASTDVSIKEIKAANRGSKGPDIIDMMKSFAIGAPAQF